MNEAIKNKIYKIFTVCSELIMSATMILLLIFIIFLFTDAGSKSQEIRDSTKSLGISFGVCLFLTIIIGCFSNVYEPKLDKKEINPIT